MFKIKIICLGRLKESFWREAEAEYLKRLRPFARLEIVEIPEIPFRSKDEAEIIKSRESELILKKIKPNDFLIALDERGKEIGSVELARFLEDTGSRGQTIAFVLGGPLGIAHQVLVLARSRLSLSRLTFTHQMARIILLEQIYRSINILSGKTYHY
jgi:23S rRNA (pseudouridine1915-N3)-methyltransferase